MGYQLLFHAPASLLNWLSKQGHTTNTVICIIKHAPQVVLAIITYLYLWGWSTTWTATYWKENIVLYMKYFMNHMYWTLHQIINIIRFYHGLSDCRIYGYMIQCQILWIWYAVTQYLTGTCSRGLFILAHILHFSRNWVLSLLSMTLSLKLKVMLRLILWVI